MLTEPDQNENIHFRDFKTGREEGFTFFYNLYYPLLARLAQHHIENNPVVEEVLHDAFLETWAQRHLIRSPKHLYSVTRLCLKWRCLHYKQQKLKEKLVYCGNIDESFTDASSENKLYNDDKYLLNLVYKALPLLTPAKANIVVLYFRDGLSCKEIARRYSVSSQRIAKQLNDSIHFLKSLVPKKKAVAIRVVPAKRI